MELFNVSAGLFERCVRAQIESMRKVRVVYHRGLFWRVKRTLSVDRRVLLEPVTAPRRCSIDDCTLAEWHAAALENRKR